MGQLDDDGMGGRLAASTVGGGIVAPYPLHHPSNANTRTSPTSPSFPVATPFPGNPNASYPNNLNMYAGGGPGSSADGHGYPGPGGMWGAGPGRHPSPGPSLANTGTTDSPHSLNNLGPGAAAGFAAAAAYAHHNQGGGGRAPSVISSSQSSSGAQGMSPGRLAKEREAYGMYNQHGPSAYPQQGPGPQGQGQFGAFGPGPAAVGAGGHVPGQRRYSGNSEGTFSDQSGGRPPFAGGPGPIPGPGSTGSGSNGTGPGGQRGSGAYMVHNPDEDQGQGQGQAGYAGGWSEEARRMYLMGGPQQQGCQGGE